MKKYFIYAVSALALAGCSSDDFLGGQPSPTKLTDNNVINFNGGSSATTRSELTGSTAATKLGNNFVVYGYKNGSEKVYDHYNVNWAGDNSKNQTESNTAGWEYVGQTPNMLSSLPSGSVQTIKYWDYSASQYDFVAFSLGRKKGDNRYITQVKDQEPNAANHEVKVTAINNTPTYTLTGAVADLAEVYIADKVTAKPTVSNPIDNRLVAYQSAVKFNFRSLGTKVRIGLYETIPGYSVKDVKFYANGTTTDNSATPTLYAENATIPSGIGTMTVTFGTSGTDLNKAHVAWAVAEGNTTKVLSLPSYAKGSEESNEEDRTDYLVRTSSDAKGTTSDNYKIVLPAKVGALKLKVDYTLVSIDGSGETINVKGATAVVPEVYTRWEPNYAYTYIFKISDNTNGSTGDGSPAGLYPITFDAIVTGTEDGLSETITTVSEPSITTYSLGAVGDEYTAGKNVYVSVVKGNAEQILTVGTNCALYTAQTAGTYPGGISEATVANCLANGAKDNDDSPTTWTATATQGNTLTVSKYTGTDFEATNTILATDAPDGNAVVVNDENGNNKNVFAKFTPSTGTYVFQYIEGGNKYYKVIKVQ